MPKRWRPTVTVGLPGGRRVPVLGPLLVALGLASACLLLFLGPGVALRVAVRHEVAATGAPAAVAAFYASRAYRPVWFEASGVWPLWTRNGIRLAVQDRARLALATGAVMPSQAGRRQALAVALRTNRNSTQRAAQAEVAITAALVTHASDLARARQDELAFVDPAFAPPPPAEEFLQWATFAPSAVRDVREVNPVYDSLALELAAYRKAWSALPQTTIATGPALREGERGERVAQLRARLGLGGGDRFDAALTKALLRFQTAHGLPASGVGDADSIAALNLGATHFENLIVANLRRAQALPPPLGERYVLVNPAAGRLWMYEGRRAVGSMKVIVGSRREPTPSMAGLIRYMVYNPYWEIPVDIARRSIAPVALRSGPGYVKGRRIQVLSDWSDAATPVSPAAINWSDVAAGRAEVRLRQAPGGDNMMGRVKFMMPNELGIYLHDTPDRGLFGTTARQLSAGCVRLERAEDLAAWIRMDRPVDPAFHGPDQVVDQFSPVTVYIIYLTAGPTPDGVRFYPDVYGRDRPPAAARRAAV